MLIPFTIEWIEQLCKIASESQQFREYARWFNSSICLNVEEKNFVILCKGGQLSLITEAQEGDITISGKKEIWDKIAAGQAGGIHRAFRHKTLHFSGNLIETMHNWKAIWFLGELMKSV